VRPIHVDKRAPLRRRRRSDPVASQTVDVAIYSSTADRSAACPAQAVGCRLTASSSKVILRSTGARRSCPLPLTRLWAAHTQVRLLLDKRVVVVVTFGFIVGAVHLAWCSGFVELGAEPGGGSGGWYWQGGEREAVGY
jgi:hypothetical protein